MEGYAVTKQNTCSARKKKTKQTRNKTKNIKSQAVARKKYI